jgi:hypothetical protein
MDEVQAQARANKAEIPHVSVPIAHLGFMLQCKPYDHRPCFRRAFATKPLCSQPLVVPSLTRLLTLTGGIGDVAILLCLLVNNSSVRPRGGVVGGRVAC